MTLNAEHSTVVRLDRSSAPHIRSVLFHSYRDEPTYQYLLEAHRPGYNQRLRATLRELVRLHFERDEVVLGVTVGDPARLVGVIFLSDIELRQDISHRVMWHFKLILTAGLQAARNFTQYFNQVQAALPEAPHRMVSLVGVLPEFQKQGIGRKLMNAVHEICAQDSISEGVYLDTGNNAYLPFYEALGYQRYATVQLKSLAEVILFRPATVDG
ncbi:GNAT family N-acetyltransferase [Salinispirillum sp. LH 10-3-1]|uniref:GNAT family N-acetyltransferase n=1 Tax=Salinispirillum sp. LH 10-3-1 TaxID=2952525 RepID=A0AB38YB95_9GAMM